MASVEMIERVIREAVTDDKAQRILSFGPLTEIFDDCLERVLQQQLQREAEGERWLGPRTQFTISLRVSRAANPIRTLYRQIFKKFGPDNFAFHLRMYEDLIMKRSRGDTDAVAQALVLLGYSFTQGGVSDDRRQAILSYFLEEHNPGKLVELGLAREIEGTDDRLFILATHFLCVLGQKAKFGTNGQIGPEARIYLLLDSVENVLELSEEACWAFTHALEHLAHDVGAGLTIWLNVSRNDPAVLQRLRVRLGSRFIQEWFTSTSIDGQVEGI